MPRKGKQTIKIIHSLDEIPTFKSEDEEHSFWQTHAFSNDLANSLPPVPEDELPPTRPRTRTRPIGIRFDDSTLERIKTIAYRRHKGYQTLVREFVTERLYEEGVREGLVKPVDRSRKP